MSWLSSREYQISGKAEYKGQQILILGGVDAQEIPGGKPEVWLTLSSELLPHDLVMGGIPHAGSQHTSMESVMQSSHLILSRPLLLLPPIPPTIKPLTVWITINCGKFFKRWEYQTTLPSSWETCTCVRKWLLEPDMKQGLVQNWERNLSRLHTVTLLV